MLEIIYDTFAIKIVHDSPKEVPVQRPREPKVLRFTRYNGDGDDFLEGYYLNCRYNSDNIDVSREH